MYYLSTFLSLIVWAIVILAICSALIAASKKRTRSDDGHAVPRRQDLTCEKKYGHQHPDDGTHRYIVHEDPEEGYVILNGVKRKIKDCDKL
jgi:hypothetical protein